MTLAAVAVFSACTPDNSQQATPTFTSERTGSGTIREVADLTLPRAAHTATLLPDGRVLVAGGCTADGCEETTSKTELYDPKRRVFTAGPDMASPRVGHTATPLPGGRVLIVGGYRGEGTAPLATAEVFDPAEGRFQPTAQMSVGRGAHSAIALADGGVLVLGGVSGPGHSLASAEIYVPASRQWITAATMTSPRQAASAVAMADGKVLVTGGQAVADDVLSTAEIYDPARGRWAQASQLHQGRYKHASSLLADGRVLVIGGAGPGDQAERLDSAELYSPTSGRFERTGSLGARRFKIPDAVVSGPDGRIVVAGGALTVEVFDAADGAFTPVDGKLSDALSFSTATRLDDGGILVAGGYSPSIRVRAAVQLVVLSR